MSSIEQKIVSEAARPGMELINAALSPTVERVRAWAAEKNLKGKLNADALASTMERYLIKLSERVGEITSITFPQLKLDIYEAYEPLYMVRNTHFDTAGNLITADELVSSPVRPTIIVDGAGMGKSTFSKFIVAKLLFKSGRIPILFDLRKVDSQLNFTDNIVTELDFPDEKFDRKLFYRLLKLGKFFVILDGFDEVSIAHQHVLANQLREMSLKGGNNAIIITTRPQEIVPDLINATSLKFAPFTQEQALSLLRRYDKISGLDVGERLSRDIASIPSKFIESPLLVSLLYRTYGVNNSIADKVSTFYDEIYHALYKGHDLINKNGYAREKKSGLGFEDFRKLLRALCHYMMLRTKTSFESLSEADSFINDASKISLAIPTSTSSFLDDLFVAVPLMQRDGTEYKFFHKTLLEYFAAEYIIFNESSRRLLKKIFESPLASSFAKVFEFLNDMNPLLFESVITQKFALEAKALTVSKNEQVNAISTCQFFNKFKIGLWAIEENSEPFEDEDGNPIFILSSDVHSSSELDYSCWREGTLNGTPFYLAISYQDKHENLHKSAWEAITSEYTANLNNYRTQYIFDGLEKIIPVEKWVRPNAKVIKELYSENIAIKDIFFAVLEDPDITAGVRVLDFGKVDTLLARIKSRSSLDIDMKDFL
ncbi:NACHT domain-containing protein [Pseudomonas sp. NFX183]|uniref:NACHT domain-containing protein n=1 Tax=Pseudomonas sp. NFX183 TaxID=3399573 RepID=UPI003A5C48F0